MLAIAEARVSGGRAAGEPATRVEPVFPPARRGKAALLATGAIRAYQYSFASIFGGQCRFLPSCSDYAIEAVRGHGPARGLALAGRRILRCHPWHPGGFDPVPLPATGSLTARLVSGPIAVRQEKA